MSLEKTINSLKSDHKNARKRTDRSANLIKESLERFGAARSIVIDENDRVLAGNGTIQGAKAAGIENVRVIETDGQEIIAVKRTGLSEEEKVGLALADNRTSDLSEWDAEMLKQLSEEQDLEPWFNADDLNDLLDEEEINPADTDPGSGILCERFGIPPFSVLNAREGRWQERKKAWLAIGIESELGREGLTDTSANPMPYFNNGKTIADKGGSIFDPVLTELAYRWFCPKEGVVVDPFAGGSVRGIVASKLGFNYIGCELRSIQVEANRKQAEALCTEQPVWHCTDSRNIDLVLKDQKADFIFSCPPYADLEVYSQDPKDLSVLPYLEFKKAYFEIIQKTCSLLNQDSFACFVVGEIRSKKGVYQNFVADTIQAFMEAGLDYYNEAILLTPVGSVPIRAGKPFVSSRKLGKVHQNVLVFVKGDPKGATLKCGDCEFGELEKEEEVN